MRVFKHSISDLTNIYNRWLYRIRPAVAHQGFTKLPNNPDVSLKSPHFPPSNLTSDQFENNFSPLNPRVHTSPTQQAWHPPSIPASSQATDFIDGLKSFGGNGDPTLREGIAVHMYVANKDMDRRAFCNNDGDFLVLPQQGRLHVQTEFGRCADFYFLITRYVYYLICRLMVRPGELLVIQRGMRFRVSFPDGPSRGCKRPVRLPSSVLKRLHAQTFKKSTARTTNSPRSAPSAQTGSQTHAILNIPSQASISTRHRGRSFTSACRSFCFFSREEIVIFEKCFLIRVCGEFHVCRQEHTPFDVVAWHGKCVDDGFCFVSCILLMQYSYVPYKYALEKFVNVGSISKDHIDPSIFCVLTAKSKTPGTPLADFLIFSPRWDVASHTFRPPVCSVLFRPPALALTRHRCSTTTATPPRSSWASSMARTAAARMSLRPGRARTRRGSVRTG